MDTQPMKRPITVTMAVAILFVVIIAGTISSFYQQTHNEALKSMAAQMPYMRNVQYGMLVVSLIFFLFLQYKIFMGRNWARITALVLFLIGVLFSIPSFLGMFPISTSLRIISAVGMTIQLVAYIMLFTGQGSAWFKRQAGP